MAVDFSSLLYLTCQDTFGRYATFTPIASNPGGGTYSMRGIHNTRPMQVQTDIGMAILTDHETIFDIRDNEFFDAGLLLPIQGDLLTIVADGDIPAEGSFEIVDVTHNGGGETTLVIRKFESAAP
jgi:hypothetical protein